MHNMRTPQGPDHESSSKMETEMAGQSAEPAMKVESVSIRKTENGAYVVSCSKVPVKRPKDGAMAYEPPKDFAFQSFPEAMDYVAQEFGEQAAPAAEPAAPMPAEGAPAAPYDEEETLA